MADIKTREVNKGSVKSIDRAANLSGRVRSATVRTKDTVERATAKDDRNESAYATDNTMQMGERVVRGNGRVIAGGSRKAYRAVSTKREMIDVKTKRRMVHRSANRAAKNVETASKAGQEALARERSAKLASAARAKKVKTAGRAAAIKRMQQAKKLENARRMQVAAKKTAERTARETKRVVVLTVKAVRRLVESARAMTAAIATAGSTAIIIILVCTLFASAIYLFGQDTKDDFSAEALGTGDTLITRVASAQIGNHGGRKFWSWYGFSSRVEWCACYVSWCANQCGYIEKGIIPRFAVVGDGTDWFKARKQFQNYKYIPAPGDIIFFDWGADGTRDHVGIVERCDGKYVYTIEGNTSDMCARRTYPVGSTQIYGYGIPKY